MFDKVYLFSPRSRWLGKKAYHIGQSTYWYGGHIVFIYNCLLIKCIKYEGI